MADDDTSGRAPDMGAIVAAWLLIVLAVVVAVVLSWLWPHGLISITVSIAAGFSSFAAFYASAQLTERIVEPLTWVAETLLPLKDKKPGSSNKSSQGPNKPNRTAVFFGLSVVVASMMTGVAGLHFISAIGVNNLPLSVDSALTALLISGGTKPLHDFISYLQQSKDSKSIGP